MDLLVDPVLYAIPDLNQNSEAHIQFVDSLATWTEEFFAKRHNFYVWQDCMDALNEADCFPYPHNLRKLWALADEQIISPDMVWAACCRLFEIPYLEQWIEDPNMHDILIDDTEFDVRPDLLDRLPPSVALTFQKALGRIAYVKATRDDTPATDMMLVTHPVDAETVAEIATYVVADGHDDRIEAELPLAITPEDLESVNDIASQWQNAEQTIQGLAKDMMRKGDLLADAKLATFSIGPDFVSSIARHHFDRRPGWLQQIYRRCVLLLTGNATTNPDKHHTLHKHDQIKRGPWGAWRIHVTGSPMAIRLHYWRQGNHYLLMHIVPHENYHIDDPHI